MLLILDPDGQTLEGPVLCQDHAHACHNIGCFNQKQLSQPQTHLAKSALAQRPGEAVSIFHDLYLIWLDVPIIQLKLVHYLQKQICQMLGLHGDWCQEMGTSRSAVTLTSLKPEHLLLPHWLI